MNKELLYKLQEKSLKLLKELISTPSYSREEEKSAGIIQSFLESNNIRTNKHLNNIWAVNKYFDDAKPTLLLNSHHDTVKPNKGYTLDPHTAVEKDGKLFGLGSNDAGGALVSLLATFLYFSEEKLSYNLIIAATAEEEISGINGVESILPILGKVDAAIVGEPTEMQMAIAERGLVVLDCMAEGKAGHAARNEGENAIYKAMMDLEWIFTYQFPEISDLLGPVKMTVTSIETANKAHNIVPSQCSFIIDVRVNELYSSEEVVDIIISNLQSTVKARSYRLRSTTISKDHPLVVAGTRIGRNYYGSPTTSDKAILPFPSLKIGPGNSARSHTANEFILIDEINNGIELYIRLLKELFL